VAEIDPSYGVGWPNYSQTGSFFAPVSPPALGPFEGPLVALPCVNYDWLRLLLGASDQLRNPSTWKDLTPDETVVVLSQVEELQANLSVAGTCVICPEIRLQDCVLQFSCDAGATWTDVAGWTDNFANCTTDIIFPPVPPNPGSDTTAQRACNIAAYLSSLMVNDVVDKAITNFNSDLTLLDFGLLVFNTIAFAFPITAIAVDVFAAFYVELTSGNIADFEAASTDPLLLSLLTCAIYNAIKTTGYITSANLPNVISNVCGITYTYPVVITAICTFITGIGIVNLRAMQNVGALAVGDCTFCSADWCKQFDFTLNNGGWTVYNNGTADYGAYVAGVGWESAVVGSTEILQISVMFGGSWNITTVDVWYSRSAGVGRHGNSTVSTGGGPVVDLQDGAGTSHTVCNIDAGVGQVVVDGEIYPVVSGAVFTVTKVEIRGLGTSPFGTSDCTP